MSAYVGCAWSLIENMSTDGSTRNGLSIGDIVYNKDRVASKEGKIVSFIGTDKARIHWYDTDGRLSGEPSQRGTSIACLRKVDDKPRKRPAPESGSSNKAMLL